MIQAMFTPYTHITRIPIFLTLWHLRDKYALSFIFHVVKHFFTFTYVLLYFNTK